MPLQHPSCPFCHSSIQKVAFAETAYFRALVNRSPILPGHSLLVPKRHTPSVLELGPDELAEFTRLAKEVTEGLLRVYQANALNWSIQEQPAAGQTVAHLHLHIVPRHDNDLPEPGDWYPQLMRTYSANAIDRKERPWLSQQEQEELAQWLREQLAES